MVPGPAPWRTMCKKPWALGFSCTSPACMAGPVGVALMSRWASSTLSGLSAAARCAAAVFALIACAVGHHQHAALGAGWGAFVGVALFCGGRRVAGRDGGEHGFDHRRICRCGSCGGGDLFASQLQIVGGDEAAA